jgi:hypothetical protein
MAMGRVLGRAQVRWAGLALLPGLSRLGDIP